MGFELWTSPVTGYRRKGTRFSSLKNIFLNNITTKSIYEPLQSCPADSDASEAKQHLLKREFNVAGVKEAKEGDVKGYVVTNEIQHGTIRSNIKNISPDLLISDSTPIADLFSVLKNKDFVFVIQWNSIDGIITIADINKPPVRLYIFGIISLFEMHLNFWINNYYKNESWIGIINKARIDKAENIYNYRKGNNQDLSLLECLEFCDKRDILAKSSKFITKFFPSKKVFEKFVCQIEKIRNELAHSQSSIIANIEWNSFIELIKNAEDFLSKSDSIVEKMALSRNRYSDMLISA